VDYIQTDRRFKWTNWRSIWCSNPEFACCNLWKSRTVSRDKASGFLHFTAVRW